MSTQAYFTNPKMLRRLHEGALGAHIDLFAARLLEEGHCWQSAWRNLRIVSDLSRWLERKGLGVTDLNEEVIEQYRRFRLRYGHPYLGDRAALLRLLAVLRGAGAVAPVPVRSLGPLEQVEDEFERHLTQNRGLARVSVIRHRPLVRQFLEERCAAGRQSFPLLTASDITRFVERHAQEHSCRSAQMMCWSLRAFPRYLQYRGEISANLAASVPSFRRWNLAPLPSYVQPREVQQILSTCDRRTPMGRRDYAILLLLARIGLRANEVRLLTLDDLDWESGQLTVQGKGRREASMPLPEEVGAAVADYLQHGRPRSESRRLFLRDLAPHRGFAAATAITAVAKRAISRANIGEVAHKGAHLLRHSLATQLLAARASLTEIGQVLRHRRHDTTRLYAKADIGSLRSLGLPWPGGTR